MNELAEEFHGWRGSCGWRWVEQLVGAAVPKPHAERRTRRALAPHDTLDGNGIKAGTFEGSYLEAGYRQARRPLTCFRCTRY